MGSQSRARRERAMARVAAPRGAAPGASFGLSVDGHLTEAHDEGLLERLTAAAIAETLPPADATSAEVVNDSPVREPPRRQVYGFGLLNGRARVAAPRLPYDRTEVVSLVARRRRARGALQRIDSAIELEVGRARTSGMSWDEIGQLLGITRQGARQRYGDRVVHTADRASEISTDWASTRRSAAEWARLE